MTCYIMCYIMACSVSWQHHPQSPPEPFFGDVTQRSPQRNALLWGSVVWHPKKRLRRRLHEPNPALWLATQPDKMAASYPLRITHCVPHKKLQLPSQGQEGWILASFMDLESVLTHKLAKKKRGQYPAILTLHLVNNENLLDNSLK